MIVLVCLRLICSSRSDVGCCFRNHQKRMDPFQAEKSKHHQLVFIEQLASLKLRTSYQDLESRFTAAALFCIIAGITVA